VGRRSARSASIRRRRNCLPGGGRATALVFAAGRFGADVGAAVGFQWAAVPRNSSRGCPRQPMARCASPVVGPHCRPRRPRPDRPGLGWQLHLTRSRDRRRGAADVADVAQRRPRALRSRFRPRPREPPFWIVLMGSSLRDPVAPDRRLVAAGFPPPRGRESAPACSRLGRAHHDSGASFLVLGSLAVGATLAFAWLSRLRIRRVRVNRKAQAGN